METAYWYISVRFGKFSNRPINVPECTKVYQSVPKCTRPSFSLCFTGKLRHLKCTKVYQNVPNCTSSRPGTVGCILEIHGAAQKTPKRFFSFCFFAVFFFCYPHSGPPRPKTAQRTIRPYPWFRVLLTVLPDGVLGDFRGFALCGRGVSLPLFRENSVPGGRLFTSL